MATFRVASFNVLGAHHTRAGSSGPHVKRGMAPSATRSRLALRALAARGISLVGLQEFEPPQWQQWRSISGGAWRFYPGMRRGKHSLARSVAWRSESWQLVRGRVFTFPYFKGAEREAPAVVLRHRASGRLLGFINVHNPANTRRFGDNSRWRREALRIQMREIAKLRRDGLPVIVTGDFNAVRNPFCTLNRRAGLVAAIGKGAPNVCRPPQGAGVDWIFGTPDLVFEGYRRASDSVIRRASDHPIVMASARFRAR